MKKGFALQPDAVINPANPIGMPYDRGPFADVKVAFAQGGGGGSQRSADEHTLEMSHAGTCRIIRAIERKIGGDETIDDRMKDLNVGYGETVGRRGIEAAKFLTGTSDAARFDQHVGRIIDAMTSQDEKKTLERLKTARDLRCQQARILRDTRAFLGKASSFMHRFRNRNVQGGDLPTFKKLSAVFLPARTVNGIETPSIDEMLVIAAFGLVNPARLYRDFSYLFDPFELATMIGSTAIYMKHPDRARRLDIEQCRSTIFERQIPECIRGHLKHVELYEAVCARVERSWHDTMMPRFIA